MEYEIYIDSIFFSNFALNFLILSLADRGFRVQKGLRRRFLGSLTGTIMYCVFLILPIPFIWLRVCLGSLLSGLAMSVISFGISMKVISKDGCRRYMEEMLFYSLLLGGAMFCMNRFFPFLGGLAGTIALGVGCYEIIKAVNAKWRNQKTNLGNAQIYKGETNVKARALFDTGNGLVEPISGKPVCVVSKQVATLLWKDLEETHFRAIPFHSVGCKAGILKGYPIDQIIVEYEGRMICVRDLYLAVKEGPLGNKGDYDMILNPRILEIH